MNLKNISYFMLIGAIVWGTGCQKSSEQNEDDSGTHSDGDSDSDSDSDSDTDSDTDSDSDSDEESDAHTDSDSATAVTDTASDELLPAYCDKTPPSDAATACSDWMACCGFEKRQLAELEYWHDGQSCESRQRIELHEERDEHPVNCRYNAQLVRCENLGTDAAQCHCETVENNPCVPTTSDPALACTAAYECCNFISPWLDSDPDYEPQGPLTVETDACDWQIEGDAEYHAISCRYLGTADAECYCSWGPNCD